MDEIKVARGLLASLYPDAPRMGDWNHPGFTVSERVEFARKYHATSWVLFGEDVITAAAKKIHGCRWCYAQARAKAYGRDRPRYTKASALLLGSPCRKCVNRWKGRVGAFAGRLKHRQYIQREVAARVHRMKLAQTPLTPPPTPRPRRSTSATRQPATRALRTIGTRRSFNVQAYDQQVMREWRNMMAKKRNRR